MTFPWLLALGFSLTFSALITKTFRINKVLGHAARFRRVTVTAGDVVKPMLTLLVLNIVVLVTWTLIDPLQRETVIISQDVFGRPTETYGVCSSEHATTFLSVLGITNLGSLLYAVFQAWRARNISTELSESTYIFAAMALILVVSLFGIPIIIIVSSSSVRVAAFYFVTAGIIFVICSSLLCLIFIPKVRALHSTAGSAHSSPRSTMNYGIQIMPDQVTQMEREISELKRLLAVAEEEKKNSAIQSNLCDSGVQQAQTTNYDLQSSPGNTVASGVMVAGGTEEQWQDAGLK